MSNSDEGSLRGKGGDILLPRRGNPFAKDASAPATSPQDANLAAASDAPAAAPANYDLTADDIAKLFPDPPAETTEPTEEISFAAPGMNDLIATETVPDEAMPSEDVSFSISNLVETETVSDEAMPAEEINFSISNLVESETVPDEALPDHSRTEDVSFSIPTLSDSETVPDDALPDHSRTEEVSFSLPTLVDSETVADEAMPAEEINFSVSNLVESETVADDAMPSEEVSFSIPNLVESETVPDEAVPDHSRTEEVSFSLPTLVDSETVADEAMPAEEINFSVPNLVESETVADEAMPSEDVSFSIPNLVASETVADEALPDHSRTEEISFSVPGMSAYATMPTPADMESPDHSRTEEINFSVPMMSAEPTHSRTEDTTPTSFEIESTPPTLGGANTLEMVLGTSAADATMANLPGVRANAADSTTTIVTTSVASAGGETVSFSIAETVPGPKVEAYKAPDSLAEDPALVKFFISDALLLKLWAELDELENRVTNLNTRKYGQKNSLELLDRIATARNLLLNSRNNVEEASRLISEVKFRYARAANSSWYEHPRIIFWYLLIVIVLVTGGAALPYAVAFPEMMAGFSQATLLSLWFTLLASMAGSVAGALWNLLGHVAQEKDYDPEFALWYYVYPVIGVLLGAFVYGIGSSGLVGSTWGGYILYVFAAVVGFQQSLALKLVNSILKRLDPNMEVRKKDDDSDEEKNAKG